MIATPSLSPRQARTLLDLATGAVIVSVAIALAGLTWRIAGHAGTGAITAPAVRGGAAVKPDVAPALALAPFGRQAAGEASQATALPVELKGVVAAVPAALSTAFISVSGAAPQAFHVGDAVQGATIQAIHRDRVILAAGGRNEFLAFPDPSLTPEQRQAAAAKGPAAGAAAPGPTPAAPGTAPVPAVSTTTVLQRFDAVPVTGGFRIGDNGPPGMLAGDVVQSINGSPIGDPAAANAAFAAAQASGSAQIQILRDGKRLTLTVPLR